MIDQHTPTCTSRVLIPWDGVSPLGQVLDFARSTCGDRATLLVLPTEPTRLPQAPVRQARHNEDAVGAEVEILDAPATTVPAEHIAAIAIERDADVILVTTLCNPEGSLDSSCLAAQLALDSPVPVMLIHVEPDTGAGALPAVRRVVVPLDGSAGARQALPFAADLASRLGLPARLLMVIDPKQTLPPGYAYDPNAMEEMVSGLTHSAHWALTQAERKLSQQGVTVSADLFYGPVVETLEAAMETGDLMVMTTHGIGGKRTDRLGSVATRLIADAPRALVIMRSTPPSEVVVREHDLLRGYDTHRQPMYASSLIRY